MKQLKISLSKIGLIALLYPMSLLADPIPDGVFSGGEAGWFPTTTTPCPVVCRKQQGAVAEQENYFSNSPVNKKTYVCKGAINPVIANPGSDHPNLNARNDADPIFSRIPGTLQPFKTSWLYGNNFSDQKNNRLCVTATYLHQVRVFKKYYCLCVLK